MVYGVTLHAQHNPFGHYRTERNKNTVTKIKEEKLRRQNLRKLLFILLLRNGEIILNEKF
jgi:hypothetical protein